MLVFCSLSFCLYFSNSVTEGERFLFSFGLHVCLLCYVCVCRVELFFVAFGIFVLFVEGGGVSCVVTLLSGFFLVCHWPLSCWNGVLLSITLARRWGGRVSCTVSLTVYLWCVLKSVKHQCLLTYQSVGMGREGAVLCCFAYSVFVVCPHSVGMGREGAVLCRFAHSEFVVCPHSVGMGREGAVLCCFAHSVFVVCPHSVGMGREGAVLCRFAHSVFVVCPHSVGMGRGGGGGLSCAILLTRCFWCVLTLSEWEGRGLSCAVLLTGCLWCVLTLLEWWICPGGRGGGGCWNGVFVGEGGDASRAVLPSSGCLWCGLQYVGMVCFCTGGGGGTRCSRCSSLLMCVCVGGVGGHCPVLFQSLGVSVCGVASTLSEFCVCLLGVGGAHCLLSIWGGGGWVFPLLFYSFSVCGVCALQSVSVGMVCFCLLWQRRSPPFRVLRKDTNPRPLARLRLRRAPGPWVTRFFPLCTLILELGQQFAPWRGSEHMLVVWTCIGHIRRERKISTKLLCFGRLNNPQNYTKQKGRKTFDPKSSLAYEVWVSLHTIAWTAALGLLKLITHS